MKRSNAATRLLRYIRPYWRWMVGAFLFMLLFAFTSGASIGMILPFFDDVLGREVRPEAPTLGEALEENASGPFREMLRGVTSLRPAEVADAGGDLLAGLREALDRARADQVLAAVIVVMLGLVLVKNVSSVVQVFFLSRAEQSMVADIRRRLYGHLIELDLDFYGTCRTGDVISRFTSDIGKTTAAVADMIMNVPKNVLLFLVYLGLAIWASWRLALVTLLVFPPAMLFIFLLGKRLRRITHGAQERLADFSSIIQETLSGIRVVKAFSMERFERGRFDRLVDVHRDTQVKLRRTGSLTVPVTEVMGAVASGAIMWYGTSAIITGGTLTTGRFLVFLAAVLSMMDPLKQLGRANSRIQGGLASAERVFSLLDRRQRVVQPDDPVPFTGLDREIRFEHVCFSYEEGKIVLEDIDLTIGRGDVVALVGPSGGGKSTLADLIPRFYDPDSGRITVDGTDLRRIDLVGLRSSMGVVTQETILFNDTVRNNIAYGVRDIPVERIESAAEAAHALEFIREMPRGLDTVIGERGVRLSGGQRQRLAIARAILKDPDILIFDEATSSLDTESERLVQEAIDRLLVEGRTSLVIAHRLSTIRKAGRVLYMERGRIVEEGTHDELMDLDGRYRRLYDMQFDARPGDGA